MHDIMVSSTEEYIKYLEEYFNRLPGKPHEKDEVYVAKRNAILTLHIDIERRMNEIIKKERNYSNKKLDSITFREKCDLIKSIINDPNRVKILVEINKIRNYFAHCKKTCSYKGGDIRNVRNFMKALKDGLECDLFLFTFHKKNY
jgi:hypothetical protein